ncbi:hypothetical protein NW768_010905 [Fusarium equiseti]|uniref:Protein kinase domain-containing protein n=1 Tax=Fusarium equiseti TaxID=61235 RepID=A0ABQ8QZ52_FUSEQ|nr:hypothetical protein NW768_010905 [Fusarium equiseti]
MALWFSRQCLGIVEGLYMIQHSSSDNDSQEPQKHGQHGDLKPENILWFRDSGTSETGYSLGTLKISDFGLTRFHGTQTKSHINTDGMGCSPTYRAPEFDVLQEVAQSYDIWCLGCVLLEFTTWYLKGWAGVESFSQERKGPKVKKVEKWNHEYREDTFFNRIQKANTVSAQAKEPVKDEVQSLYKHEDTSDLIIELVEFLETSLLRLHPDRRKRCPEVLAQFSRFFDTCCRDQYYCLEKRKTPPIRKNTDNSDLSHLEPVDLHSSNVSLRRASLASSDRPTQLRFSNPILEEPDNVLDSLVREDESESQPRKPDRSMTDPARNVRRESLPVINVNRQSLPAIPSPIEDSKVVEAPVEPVVSDTIATSDEESQRPEQTKRLEILAFENSWEIKPQLDIPDVLQLLGEVDIRDQAAHNRHSKIKDRFNKTLQCVSSVGGLAASGASEAFAPAQTCFNALTFVIKAWQDYQGAFESLANLFEKCIDFLGRLEEYQTRIDAKLQQVACQHLLLFVEICDCSIRLASKKAKATLFVRISFLGDNQIKALLSDMEQLVDKERNLVAARTLNIAVQSNQKLDIMLEGEETRKGDLEVKKWKRSIVKALEFDQSTLDREGEPVQIWAKSFTTIKNSLIHGTGNWLLQNSVFKSWAYGTGSSKPILILHGTEGSGKTYSMANVLKLLPQLQGTSRPILAYHFLESDNRKSQLKQDVFSSVSRYLLWQCATASEPLTQSMADVCKDNRQFDGTKDVWDKLLFTNKAMQRMDATFFIAIDGLDERIQEFQALLAGITAMATKNDMKIRILLTAKTKSLDSLYRNQSISFSAINVSENNHDDIRAYITHRMNSMDTLGNTNSSEACEWREKILVRLSKTSGDDYFKLATALDAIGKMHLVADIEQALANADSSREEQIVAEIKTLQKTLTAKEVSEVNLIILWLVSGNEYPSLSELEAILALDHENDSKSTRSLLPLEKKLESRYLLFQVNSAGLVQWKSEGIKDQIPRTTINTSVGTDFGSSKHISPAEVSLVEHFLKQICPSELFNKFEFDDFFEGKRQAQRANFICWDEENAHIHIAIICLKSLTGVQGPLTEKLRSYANRHLMHHLTRVELDLAARELKGQVGLLLVKLFTTDTGIDSLFWVKKGIMGELTWSKTENLVLNEARRLWLHTSEGVNELERWFNDKAVIQGIQGESNDNFVKALKRPEANKHEALLGPAAKHLASHLLVHSEFGPRQYITAVRFLLGYVLQIRNIKHDYKLMTETWRPSSGDIDLIEKWAVSVFGEDAVDSTWHMQFAFLRGVEPGREVIARAQMAMEHDTSNVVAGLLLVTSLAGTREGNWEAVQILKHLVQVTETKIREADGHMQDRSSLEELLFLSSRLLAERYLEIGDSYDQAAQTHRKCIGRRVADFELCALWIKAYHKDAKFQAVIDLIEEIIRAGPWPHFFADFFKHILFRKEVQEILAWAADEAGNWGFVDGLYTQAIEMAIEGNHASDLFLLRVAYGHTLHKAGNNEDKLIEVWEVAFQTGKLSREKGEEIAIRELMVLARSLAQLYLKRSFNDTGSYYVAKIGDLFLDTDPINNIMVACCLARIHCRNGQLYEAKKTVAIIVDTVLKWLSDGDPFNDQLALLYLRVVVTALGDERNTGIVWQLLNSIKLQKVIAREQWELTQKMGQNTPAPNPPSPDGFCDGCGAQWFYIRNAYFCSDCTGDVGFDEDCYRLFKSGKLGKNICDESHSFIYIPPWDEKLARSLPDYSVMTEEGVVTLEEWKTQIREEYLGVVQPSGETSMSLDNRRIQV